VRHKVEVLKQRLWVRGTLPQLDGTRKRQRISLKLKATEAELNRAESRALQLHDAIGSGAYPACGLPLEEVVEVAEAATASTAEERITVGVAVHHSTYHRWLDQADVVAVAAALRQKP